MKITGDQSIKMLQQRNYFFWAKTDFPGVKVKLSDLKIRAIDRWATANNRLIGAKHEYRGDSRVDVTLYRTRK